VTELLGIITASSVRPGLNADEKALYEELKGRSGLHRCSRRTDFGGGD
jgi:hypothetical protein